MKKYIVFFHPYFSDGGLERTNIMLAKGFIEDGYHVIFLTTNYTNHFQDEIDKLGIELISLGNKKTILLIFSLKNFLDKLSEKNFIYFISCQYYVNVVSMLVSKIMKYRKNIKFINSERNHIEALKYYGKLKSKITFSLVKSMYKNADIIVANSKETAKDLNKLLKLDVKYVYNPTINYRLESLKEKKITEKWFLQDKRECIISIGRLSYEKDFKTLIKAFDIFNKDKKYKLVILGEGEKREELENLIKELNIQKDVYLPGFVKNPYKFLNNVELFVLSSLYEGLPNVLIEALYLNVKSLSTKCKSGPKEILLDDERFLCNVGDYKEMAKKIEFLINNEIKKDFKLDRFKYENVIKEFKKVIL